MSAAPLPPPSARGDDDDPAAGHKRARPSSPPSESRCRHLRVSSLPGNCTLGELRLMFEPHGRVPRRGVGVCYC